MLTRFKEGDYELINPMVMTWFDSSYLYFNFANGLSSAKMCLTRFEHLTCLECSRTVSNCVLDNHETTGWIQEGKMRWKYVRHNVG